MTPFEITIVIFGGLALTILMVGLRDISIQLINIQNRINTHSSAVSCGAECIALTGDRIASHLAPPTFNINPHRADDDTGS